MAIFPHGNRIRVDVQIKGQRYVRSFPTRSEAETWVTRAKALAKLGMPIEDAAQVAPIMTLQDCFRLACKEWNQQRDGAGSIRNAEAVLEILDELRSVTSLTVDDVALVVEEYQEQGASNATINRKLAALSRMLKLAQARGLQVPPLSRLPEGEGRVRFLTDLEEEQVLAYFNAQALICLSKEANEQGSGQVVAEALAELVAVALDTGGRLSELLAMHARWIRRGADGVYLLTFPAAHTKSGKTRTIPLTDRATAILVRRVPRGDIWPTTWTKDTVGAAWRAMRKAIGLDGDPEFVFHACRHTCATRLLEATGDLALVQEWLGHADIRTTKIYAKVVATTMAKGAAALNARRTA